MDDDNYTELKELGAMRTGSLNTLISKQVPLRRPPSLSESCAWNPENVERATTILQLSAAKKFNMCFQTNLSEKKLMTFVRRFKETNIRVVTTKENRLYTKR